MIAVIILIFIQIRERHALMLGCLTKLALKCLLVGVGIVVLVGMVFYRDLFIVFNADYFVAITHFL
jgi:hypothetical protein